MKIEYRSNDESEILHISTISTLLFAFVFRMSCCKMGPKTIIGHFLLANITLTLCFQMTSFMYVQLDFRNAHLSTLIASDEKNKNQIILFRYNHLELIVALTWICSDSDGTGHVPLTRHICVFVVGNIWVEWLSVDVCFCNGCMPHSTCWMVDRIYHRTCPNNPKARNRCHFQYSKDYFYLDAQLVYCPLV